MLLEWLKGLRTTFVFMTFNPALIMTPCFYSCHRTNLLEKCKHSEHTVCTLTHMPHWKHGPCAWGLSFKHAILHCKNPKHARTRLGVMVTLMHKYSDAMKPVSLSMFPSVCVCVWNILLPESKHHETHMAIFDITKDAVLCAITVLSRGYSP